MKTALALAFIVACPTFGSDPTSDKRFELEPTTLERTLSGMKRLRPGATKAEVERLLPVASMKCAAMTEPIDFLIAYVIDGKYLLRLGYKGTGEKDYKLEGADLVAFDRPSPSTPPLASVGRIGPR